jgi:hypothetical protein
MKTAPVSPPPRPPRNGNVTLGSYDWHNNPNSKGGAIFHRWGRMFLKLVVVGLLAIAVGQLALVLFQIVRLQFVS